MVDVTHLSAEDRRAAVALLQERAKRESRKKLFTYYPDEGPLRRELYPKHLAFFKAGATYRERCDMAANRVGKTEGIGGYELTLHLTGLYPPWWEGRRFDKPIRAWAAGTTAETTRDILQRKLLGPLDNLGTGLIPYNSIIEEPKRDSGIPDCVETVLVRHKPSGGVSRLQFKAYKQGRKSFEGDEQDVILLDEEPPLDVYGECVIRTMTTHGMIMLGFTPMEGLTDTVLAFMPGGQVPKEQKGSKFIIGITWDEVPHLTAEDKAELLESIPRHLRMARSKGVPNIGSGAIFPYDEEYIRVPDFEVPEYFPRAYGMDVGWNCTGVVWVAWDRHNDIVYVTGVYKKGKSEPEVHAKAIRDRGGWIPGVIDPAAMGSGQKDGTKLMDEYIELDLDLSAADNAVESGLFAMEKRITTGRLKVFASCTEWFEEYRIYRRDKNGHVVKENDHLMDPTRYVIMSGLDIAKTRPRGKWLKGASVTEIMNNMPLGRSV